MKFLLTTIGTVGDINGFLGVGDCLRKRGHEVTFITNPRYEALVKKVGVDFIPLGDKAELTEFLDHPDFYNNSKGWKLCLQPLFLSPMKQQYEIVANCYVPNETVVVGSCWAFGARIAHEKIGVPMATIHLETQNVRSLYQTPLMPPPMVVRDWVPQFAKRIQFWLADRWFIDPRLVPATNEFRQSLGLPRVKRLLNGWWNSPQRIIGLYPNWFYPPQPDWPSQMVLTGFSNWDQGQAAEIPRELDEFMAAGEPPVVFYVGLNNIHAHRFFEAAAAACAALGERGVLVSTTEDQLPDPLPGGVQRFSYVPFRSVLRRSRAIVHHGGRGTASQALEAGIPQVVTPMTFGQLDTAFRLKSLGVAEIVKPRAMSPQLLTKRLRTLLASESVSARCEELASRFAGSDPLEQTCDLLEELVGTDAR